jgi:hypothetical protein
LKRWLAARPAAATVAELQTQLDTFTHIYNQTRPHRALHGATPAQAYAPTIKAAPLDQDAREPHTPPRRRRRPRRFRSDHPHRR